MSFLEINNVQKHFASFTAVEMFNLKVNKGEFVSFLGPSGCGKTTTLRMVAGFETPSAGEIIIDGKDVTNLPANQRKIGMVFQSYALFPNMTVRDNIGFGLRIAGKPAALIRQRAEEMLAIIHMQEFAARYPHQLSGGQQQRVALARALAFQPQVLLLDEPLSALDAKIRLSLRQEIRQIQRQLGITTIYVTHDQEEALSISDRIVVMSKGRIEQIGRPPEIYNTPQTPFVASFVGTLNVINAAVEDRVQGIVSLSGQRFGVGKQLPDDANGHISIALRPEAFTLVQPGQGATDNVLEGRLEDMYFLGSVVRLRIRVGDQTVNADVFNNLHLQLPEIGQGLIVQFAPSACIVMKPTGQEAAVAEV